MLLEKTYDYFRFKIGGVLDQKVKKTTTYKIVLDIFVYICHHYKMKRRISNYL